MKNNGIFDKYYSRLVKEGVIKSGACGLITGFAVMFAVALLSWIFGFAGGIWLALGLFVACSAAVGVAFYFLKFKPCSTSRTTIRILQCANAKTLASGSRLWAARVCL